MNCQECNHGKEECGCLFVVQFQRGCVYCILPVLGCRKIIRRWKNR